jgi:hypothetical protein
MRKKENRPKDGSDAPLAGAIGGLVGALVGAVGGPAGALAGVAGGAVIGALADAVLESRGDTVDQPTLPAVSDAPRAGSYSFERGSAPPTPGVPLAGNSSAVRPGARRRKS